ncbi:MAG: cysteine hydrolase [Sphingobium sp.]|nr:cysteine hydrolase [Sphingobium sp.]
MTILRDAPLTDAGSTALLVVDVQYEVAGYGYGDLADYDRDSLPDEKRYYMDRIEQVMLPNIRALQDAFRAKGAEVIFTTVENLTDDGRDRSLDYKVSGINVARGSKEAQVLEEIAPQGDEIRLPKTTSSVFNSTIIEYLLRNLGITRLVIVGLLTDQCVISAVRDACDKGFLVVVPEDACATYTPERHEWALELTKGYCRVTNTPALLDEMAKLQ